MTDKLRIDFLSDMLEDEVEFFPMLSLEEEEEMNKEEYKEEIPILPLKNSVLFPGVITPITVGRDKSIQAVKEAYKTDKIVGVIAQKDSKIEEPEVEDLNKIGTLARIVKMLKMPDGSTTAIIQGKKRFEVKEYTADDPVVKAQIRVLEDVRAPKENKEFQAITSSMRDLAKQIIKLSPNIPSEASIVLKNMRSDTFLINFIASNLNIEIQEKQRILEMNDLKLRAQEVLKHMNNEIQMLELKNQIQSKVKSDIEKQQRDYFLHQQLKTIKEELGGDSIEQEMDEMKERAKKKKWSKQVAEIFEKELHKLHRINPASPEYSVSLNYIELLLDLPWEEYTKDKFNLKRAKKILDRDHYGLEKVKDRILEYLAVLKLKGDMKSPILCFVGPPGVGKTSLGRSIAKALERKYVRMSLGGLHDESEIRGHRKTYIGAMPGRIIQSLKKIKSSNPVFILDEVDKVGSDFRGDPSSALLEVLDPEQNNTFYDNYLELEYDLSKVMFIATANSLNEIQPALRDRMEIIYINGYSTEEKLEIARQHLIPKQIEAHGLKNEQVKLSKKVIEMIIENHTRESGVRELNRKLASVMRSIAKAVAMEEDYNVVVQPADVEKYLGIPKFEKEISEKTVPPGVAIGLAWTNAGGDILFLETALSKGKGNLTLTGNLGDVMKESTSTALTFLKAHAEELDIDPAVFDKYNVHVHVPEGAIPKDGPSAGITMLTTLASAFTQRKVKAYVAMTGEITLRGKVLPVGGIKEKILAAKRAGIKEIILCKNNEKNISEIKQEYLKGLTLHYVEDMLEVLEIALEKKPIKGAVDLLKLVS